ncbi:MAG: hypothetical protein IKP64_07460 [Selenomonadaceae bacterium]|nr:hypothetical protein [Selenomonadaceae bacterium]MBR4383379.1 hypothetical protein [Selenomonadaceae bacterium]
MQNNFKRGDELRLRQNFGALIGCNVTLPGFGVGLSWAGCIADLSGILQTEVTDGEI